MTVPYWVQDAIFYQIFPDRFANGNPRNDPPNVERWGSQPTIWNFQGGDLRGVIEKFDYLLDLGINAIYFNPIFQASTTHRYNVLNYYEIDPKLGSLADFQALLSLAHSNHIRVILDGVFNHCGRGFFAFNDILENQEFSPYRDWYHIKRYPVEAYGPGEARDYLAWWGHKSLPKFNTSNPDVRRYLMNVARYWIEMGADGWRLDVPNEIDDDRFWAEFRETVKSVNPDAYLVGEIWTADLRWIGDSHFDGLMNYPLRDAILELLDGKFLPITQFGDKVEGLLSLYPRPNAYSMYLPLGSHDTERLLTRLDNSVDKVKLAYLFTFAYPGAPAVYYGDEIGLRGGKDPESRGAFPWNQEVWIEEIRGWVKSLVHLRKRSPALRRGNYQRVLADDKGRCYAFARSLGDEILIIALNASPSRRKVSLPVAATGLPDGRILRNLLGLEETCVSEGVAELELLPWEGVVLG